MIMKCNFVEVMITVAYGFLIWDVSYYWNEYKSCEYPINLWLLCNYIGLLLFRYASNMLGNARIMWIRGLAAAFLIFIFAPFICVWTVLGILWESLNKSDCIPVSRYPSIIIFWLIVDTLLTILILVVFIMEMVYRYRRWRVQRRIRQILRNDQGLANFHAIAQLLSCLLYTSPSPRDQA
eukprot:TRINITY_DN14114_c0_g1_i2.p2 TRINITY_DN14114_c0_g1~~TRINITY_DN14114_c0_g1_i2.p2  ORF type:complete len:180 (-),score=22.85 TRINITY_DN14114_c0_g1_i2:49-588(-)